MKKIMVIAVIIISSALIGLGSYTLGCRNGAQKVCDIYSEGLYGLEIGESGNIYDGDASWTITRNE